MTTLKSCRYDAGVSSRLCRRAEPKAALQGMGQRRRSSSRTARRSGLTDPSLCRQAPLAIDFGREVDQGRRSYGSVRIRELAGSTNPAPACHRTLSSWRRRHQRPALPDSRTRRAPERGQASGSRRRSRQAEIWSRHGASHAVERREASAEAAEDRPPIERSPCFAPPTAPRSAFGNAGVVRGTSRRSRRATCTMRRSSRVRDAGLLGRHSRRDSVAQQFVDAGLAPRPRVDALDDHRAIEAEVAAGADPGTTTA